METPADASRIIVLQAIKRLTDEHGSATYQQIIDEAGMLEDALHYLERRRVHLATKVLGNTDVPYTSRVKCGLEREAILMAESAVKAEIGCEMVRSMRDVV